MRGNRHEKHGKHMRVHDGAARGHRVGGAARGRTHQNAVGALHGHLLAVNVNRVFDHAEGAAVADADVVDGNA